MSFRLGTDRRRLLTTVGVALYAFVLITAAFEHHDLLCHLKNPQHCTACTSSQLGSDPQTLAVPGSSQLADAGCAIIVQVIAGGALLSVSSTGRSPPLHA